MADIAVQLMQEFNLKPFQVQNTIRLVDEGSTIPFIARYRKEQTGELNDQVLREFYERLVYLRNLESRKEDVRRLIDEQGKLTSDISKAIDKCKSMQEIEDVYRPFKPKRRTRASIAREKGLDELANILFSQEPGAFDIFGIAEEFIDATKGVNNVEEALAGAMDIIAEEIADNALNRRTVRELFYGHGTLVSKALKEEDSVYRMYYDFREPVSKVAKHRVLAINRGEKEEYLQVRIEVPEKRILSSLKAMNIKGDGSVTAEYVKRAIEDSYKRLIVPSIENEVRNGLTEAAGEQAMKVFAENLKNLLLQPPVKGRVVLGLDPAYRTGCKIAVVDDIGKVLATTVIFPTPPESRIEEAEKILLHLVDKYKVDIVSIGNGTASRESEIFTANALKKIDKKVYYMLVSEAGASVYSASKLGADEFPEFDVSLRSAVSIARRLQDPLAELVKIDPKAIGVGQYQHDMNQKRLSEALGTVVEDCVNSVGVDLNTASPSLLAYVSGINSTVAKNIVEYRGEIGRFKSRRELKKVKKLGDKTFEQCAGFLRILDGKSILDNTSVHPESYSAAEKLLEIMCYSLDDVKNKKLIGLQEEVEKKGIGLVAEAIGVGVPTLCDIASELLKPGRDPRDELPKPILLTDVLDIADISPGMLLTGTIRNVADFGAFVDIGVHQDGLVHISELADRFVKNPMDVVSVGDIVKVRVLSVDSARKRISLSMKGI
jgi:uncharacterized protein